jgi:hypothetical protein
VEAAVVGGNRAADLAALDDAFDDFAGGAGGLARADGGRRVTVRSRLPLSAESKRSSGLI